MSGFTGTQVELLYAFGGASTNLATFTTEDNLLKTYPLIKMPDMAQLLPNTGAHSSSLRLRAAGLVGSTATPTFTFSVRLLTSTTWSAGGVLLAQSGAVTAASGVTLAPWQVDLDIVVRTLAVAAGTATVVAGGTVSGAGFPSAGGFPANNVSPAVSTIDITAQYYLFLSAACSASSASNLINTQLLKLYGEN